MPSNGCTKRFAWYHVVLHHVVLAGPPFELPFESGGYIRGFPHTIDYVEHFLHTIEHRQSGGGVVWRSQGTAEDCCGKGRGQERASTFQ